MIYSCFKCHGATVGIDLYYRSPPVIVRSITLYMCTVKSHYFDCLCIDHSAILTTFFWSESQLPVKTSVNCDLYRKILCLVAQVVFLGVYILTWLVGNLPSNRRSI